MQSKSAAREIGIALGTAAVVIASEFFFRHYVTFWLPVVGNLLVTDSIALLLAYTFLLVAARRLMDVKLRDEVAGIGQALIELVTKWKGPGQPAHGRQCLPQPYRLAGGPGPIIEGRVAGAGQWSFRPDCARILVAWGDPGALIARAAQRASDRIDRRAIFF